MPWKGPSSTWPVKYVRMDPDRKRRFEAACRALGIREYEVLDQLVEEWLSRNESQIKLSHYLEGPRPVLIQADRVEISANKAVLLTVKTELHRILRILKLPDVDSSVSRGERFDRTQFKKQVLAVDLPKILQKARYLHWEVRTGDTELQDLVAQAEAYLSVEPH